MLTQAESTRKNPTGGEDVRMGSDVHMWKPLYIECVASYTVFLLDARRLKVNIHHPHIQRPKYPTTPSTHFLVLRIRHA